ncbi:MAG: tetratricopeptide repeat protein [Syntrophales bacterium]|nr:tetratricopeptide repeat protein [Syntrophales bacterium]
MLFPKSRLLLIAVTALLVLVPRSESWGNESGCVRYGIRVASSKNFDGAMALADSFKVLGLKSFCRKVDIPGKGQWCRVFIGTYTEREQAFEVGRQLENRGTIREFIVQKISDCPEDGDGKPPVSPPLVQEEGEKGEAPSALDIAGTPVPADRKKDAPVAPSVVVAVKGRGAVFDKAQEVSGRSPLYRMAMAYFGSGRHQEALTHLEKIREQGDSSGVNLEFLLRRIADCHYFIGEEGSRPDFLKAITRYRNIIRDYPRSHGENETTLYRLAKSYEYSKLYYEALGEFENFSFQYPQSVYISEAIFMTAQMRYFTEQYAEATKKLKEYLSRFPGAEHEGVATFYLAECYLQVRQYDDAGAWYERTLREWSSLEKIPPPILMRVGEYYFQVGEYGRALEIFSLCVNLFPEEKDCKKALIMLAQALMKADRLPPSLKVLGVLLERYPESEEAQKGAILIADAGVEKPELKVPLYILSGMGHYREPIHTYDEMIDKTRDLDAREAFIYRKVHALAEEGRYQEAFACCDRLLAASPQGMYRDGAEKDLIRSSAHLVDDYYSKQDYLAVSELYFKTYENGLFENGGFDLLFKMGSSLGKIGLADSASGVFEKMLVRFSDHKERDKISLAAANADYQRGLYERAEDRLEDLCAVGVHVEEEVMEGASKLAGDIYCRRNQFSEAVSLYSKVPDVNRDASKLADIYKGYGDSLKEKGKYGSAVKMYQEALAQCPGGGVCPGPVFEESCLEIADCFYREGDYERANTMYEKGLNGTAESKDVWAVLNMCRGYLNMGDKLAAEKNFSALKEKSVDKFWKDVADYYLNNETWSEKYGEYIHR